MYGSASAVYSTTLDACPQAACAHQNDGNPGEWIRRFTGGWNHLKEAGDIHWYKKTWAIIPVGLMPGEPVV
jgi:hypothetical protein